MQVVVLVDGEDRSRTQLAQLLAAADFTVAEAADGLDALRKVFALRPTAVVMDLKVPRMDGLELVRILRAATDIPLVAIAGEASPQMAVRALDLGADDYLEKGLDPVEFLARLRATIRRCRRQAEAQDSGKVVRTGALVIDLDSQTVTRRGLRVQLTRTEYRLLEALAMRPAQVAPHRYLLSVVWGEEYVEDTHYLRVYIGYLRAKLEDDPANPRYLLNEWGVGYRLALQPPEGDEAVDALAVSAFEVEQESTTRQPLAATG